MYAVDERDVVIRVAGIPYPSAGAPEQVVVLRFGSVYSLMFGPPNDETLLGHPLYDRGLDYYAVHSVDNSSWVRRLERMNSVHPMHDASRYLRLRHFIVTFHDSTFECVSSGEPTVEIAQDTTPDHASRAKPTAPPPTSPGGS